MNELDLHRQKNKRGYSVAEALEDASVEGFNQILIAGVTEDGAIDIFYSMESSLAAIGVLEVLKSTMLNEMQD